MPEGSHQKHSNLSRPGYGRFHHCEWALLGAPCDRLRELARELTERMSPGCRVGYVDADHSRTGADDMIEAGAYAQPSPTRPRTGARKRAKRVVEHHPHDPDSWRVSFTCGRCPTKATGLWPDPGGHRSFYTKPC